MTPEQAARVTAVDPQSLWVIPDGSWLAVRRSDRGTWLEVIDPAASVLLAFDFGTGEPLRSALPVGGDERDRQGRAGGDATEHEVNAELDRLAERDR